MLAALSDATWERIRITQSHDETSLDGEGKVGPEGKAAIETWAKSRGFSKDEDWWIQKWQPPPAARAGITFHFEAGDRVTFGEHIGRTESIGACAEHPSQKQPVTPTPPGTREPTDDELIKQMMGE